MVDNKLNKDQLRQLKQFIRKRGFRDEGEIAEILDHFACKVEEKIAENDNYDLEKAMVAAHKTFGPTGFRNISMAYERMMRKKNNAIYWGEIKNSLTQPLMFILLALVGYTSYKAYIWASTTSSAQIVDSYNSFVFGFYALYIAVAIVQYSNMPPVLRGKTIKRDFLQNFEWLPWILIWNMPDHIVKPEFQPAVAMYCAIVIVFLTLHNVAKYKVHKKAAAYYEEIAAIDM